MHTPGILHPLANYLIAAHNPGQLQYILHRQRELILDPLFPPLPASNHPHGNQKSRSNYCAKYKAGIIRIS